jgi:DNA-binding HxlR family transcriptional regulator
MKKNRSHCPVNYALEIFGDKWTLLIIRDLALFGKRTYGELRNSREKIATNILADRLRLMEQEGIIIKETSPGDNKVYLYRLTRKGLDLLPALFEIILWSTKYDPETSAPPGIIKRIEEDRETVIKEITAATENTDKYPANDEMGQ